MHGSRRLGWMTGAIVTVVFSASLLLSGCKGAQPEASDPGMRTEKMKSFMQTKMKAGKAAPTEGTTGR